MSGRSLRDFDLRAKFNLNVIAIVKKQELFISPSPDQILNDGDKLAVIGQRDKINDFANMK
ncbi:hypothetical protein G6549_26455 [Bacillus sp. MM2020_1]|nr:hypothetical protein [Bacillus sp. MM2020_1]